MVSVGGAVNCSTGAPVAASFAVSSYTGDKVWRLVGAGVVDGVTETFVSDATLDGAKLTVAVESGLEIVPPFVGETVVGGGERPLALFAFGSGG